MSRQKQTPMRQQNPQIRIHNFDEVPLGYSEEEAMIEAERCLQCPTAPCVQGCPVSVDIPRFIRHLLVRDIEGARDVSYESNIFPSVCGRVCPQESQCEAQCIIHKKMDSVGIGRLERFVGDHAPPRSAQPIEVALAERLGKVAIVGSVPSGLAAAHDLALLRRTTVIFSQQPEPGDVLRPGILHVRPPH